MGTPSGVARTAVTASRTVLGGLENPGAMDEVFVVSGCGVRDGVEVEGSNVTLTLSGLPDEDCLQVVVE